jgi:DUF971 family protein
VTPTAIKLHKRSKLLEISYGESQSFQLEAELLRAYSPSAEGGNYALRLTFDDGHSSGLYSWETLADLAHNQQARWDDYLARLAAAGASREPLPAGTQVITIKP